MSEKTVFISYRRRDPAGSLFARSIKEALTAFGYDVYLDVDSLNAGNWAAQILTQVPKRSHFLLLLTRGALDPCVNEDDWVRREYFAAVGSGRNIVPIREASVDLESLRQSCPECMKSLFECQIAQVHHNGFARDIAMLIERYIAPHQAPTESDSKSNAQIRDVLRPADEPTKPSNTRRSPRAWTAVPILLVALIGVLGIVTFFAQNNRTHNPLPSTNQSENRNIDIPKSPKKDGVHDETLVDFQKGEHSPNKGTRNSMASANENGDQNADGPKSATQDVSSRKSRAFFQKDDHIRVGIKGEKVPYYADADTNNREVDKVGYGEAGVVIRVRNSRCLVKWKDEKLVDGWVPFDYLVIDSSGNH